MLILDSRFLGPVTSLRKLVFAAILWATIQPWACARNLAVHSLNSIAFGLVPVLPAATKGSFFERIGEVENKSKCIWQQRNEQLNRTLV